MFIPVDEVKYCTGTHTVKKQARHAAARATRSHLLCFPLRKL
jgi:hypothetical protein